MEALEIYKSLSQPPRSALREIKGGNLNGKTDINPQWRYEAMTERFGLVGLGWKYEIQKLWTEPGAAGEALAFAQVAVYIRDPETKEWSDAIVGIGGSKLTQAFSKGLTSNDEGYKMAVTDAFSTSLKMIGVAADIYAGRWDGSKYKDQPEEPARQQAKPQQAQNKGPAGGPDTPEQTKRINELLSTKLPNFKPMFSKQDCAGITNLRATKTADEVILLIHEEIKERNLKWNAEHPPKSNQVEDQPGYYQETPKVTAEEEAAVGAIF